MAQSNFLNVKINPKIIFEGAATLVIALAFNSTMREVIDAILPKSNYGLLSPSLTAPHPDGATPGSKIKVNIIYTVLITLIVLVMVYLINRLSDVNIERLYRREFKKEDIVNRPINTGVIAPGSLRYW
jgi:Family of unknown function (DUF5654)